MLSIFVSKFNELILVVENKDPHRLHARLKQTQLQIPPGTQHYFGAEPIFYYDFGRLAGTESVFLRRQGCGNRPIFHHM